MPRNRGQPGGELRWLFNRRQRFEGQQQSLLRDIFGELSPDDCLRGSHYRGPIAQCQLIERVEIAQDRLDHKNFVRLLDACLGHRCSILSRQRACIVIETSYVGKDSLVRKGSVSSQLSVVSGYLQVSCSL